MGGNIVKLIFEASARGFEKVSSSLVGVANKAKGTARACAGIVSALSSSDSKLGQAANHVSQFVGAFAALGPVGAAIAGLQIIIEKVSQFFIDRANKMAEAAKRAGDAIREKLAGQLESAMKRASDALEAATTQAQRQAKHLETLANAYLKVANAKDAAAKAGDDAQASALTLEKSQKVSEAATPEEKARIGAEYDVRIAKEGVAATQAQQDAAVAAAQDAAAEAYRQYKRSKRDEKKNRRAVDVATEEYETVAASGAAQSVVDQFAEKKKAAEEAYANAVNDRIAKGAAYDAAEEGVKSALSARTTAINNANRTLVEAEAAQKELAKAQNEAEEATKAKARAELASVEAANRKAAIERQRSAISEQGGKAAEMRSAAGGYRSRFEAAFELWRDPAAAEAAQDAAKAKTADFKRFQQAVNRYGGKGKIDEAAALMRQGDEAGLQERLAAWRKSSKFSGQTEQMVLAAAAQQNEKASERSLANIEKNTADLAKKLDELMKAK